MKKSAKVLGTAVAAAAVGNMIHAAAFRPEKRVLPPLPDEALNVERYRKHLSKAIQFRTISSRDSSLVDWKEFDKFHKFLDEAYPLIAEKLEKTYTSALYPTFRLSCYEGEGIAEFSSYIKERLRGKVAAFAGASGVGKSTLINALFPEMKLAAGEISRKIARGKHTTRQAELFPLEGGGFLADTPGFSMIDFENFDFFPFDDLPDTMREFREHYGECKYLDCSHTKEEGCAILEAIERGEIAPSRHESYLSMYKTLKAKPRWEKRQ